jgi:hypothetical protein
VFKISDFLNNDRDLEHINVDFRPTVFVNTKKCSVLPVYCSKKFDFVDPDEMKLKVGVDEINFIIAKSVLSGNQVIIKAKNLDNLSFVKTINIESSKPKYYFEGDKFLFSGCGNFIWDQTKMEVIDIKNDLCTFFYWPGG